MIYIGCHLSVTDGYEAMGKTMQHFGGSTFSCFTRNSFPMTLRVISTGSIPSSAGYINTVIQKVSL